MTHQIAKLVAERAGVRFVVTPRPQLGCGDMINDIRSPKLIQGIEIEALTQYPDDRGYFAELFRFGQPGIAGIINQVRAIRFRFPSPPPTLGSLRRYTITFNKPTCGHRSPGCFRFFSVTCGSPHLLAGNSTRCLQAASGPGNCVSRRAWHTVIRWWERNRVRWSTPPTGSIILKTRAESPLMILT